MYNKLRFLAVIPARGGSKGIPNKNIIDVCGKPLIEYTIEQAIKSKYIDRVIVSTDSTEIAKVSTNAKAEVPFLRPEHLARDESKTIDSLIHTVDWLKEQGDLYDYIVLLQPTQPLRLSEHIDQAIEKLISFSAKSLASISKVQDHPVLIRSVDENGMLHSILNASSTVRRQDMIDYFKINGAIYINKIDEDMFNSNTSLNDNSLSFYMDSKYDLDIDDYSDLMEFERRLNEI